LYLRKPTSKGREGLERGDKKGGKCKKKGNGMKREARGKGGKERGVDLPDQCQTASYAPDLCMHLLLWGCFLYHVT